MEEKLAIAQLVIKFPASHRTRRFITVFTRAYHWSLSLHHAMKAYWGSGGIDPRILTLALDGGEWSALLPACFTPMERALVPIG
jgi:hypothetical protein